MFETLFKYPRVIARHRTGNGGIRKEAILLSNEIELDRSPACRMRSPGIPWIASSLTLMQTAGGNP